MQIKEIMNVLDAKLLRRIYDVAGAVWSEVNIAGFRSVANPPDDHFDDCIALCIELVTGEPIFHIYTATTDPGKWWTLNPVTYKGVKGAAHLCEGFYKGMWRVGTHASGSKFAHEALVAAHCMIKFWRDTNENQLYDPETDVIQEDYNDMIGINCHRAGLDDPTDIGMYGAGCQVLRYHKAQQQMMALIKASNRYKQNQTCTFDYLLVNKDIL